MSESTQDQHSRQAHFQISLSALMSILLISVVLVVGVSVAAFDYYRSKSIILEASSVVLDRVQREAALQVEVIFSPVSQFVDYLAIGNLTRARTLEERLKHLPFFVEAMRRNAALSAMYVGYENGDFFLMRRVANAGKTVLNVTVPPTAVYLVQSIATTAQGGQQGRFIFFDEALEEVSASTPQYQYDPRQRSWFREALTSMGQIQSDPYLFFSTREIGITIARAANRGGAVVGADIALTDLSLLLAKQHLSPSSELILVDDNLGILSDTNASGMQQHWGHNGSGKLLFLHDLPEEKYQILAARLAEHNVNTPIKIRIAHRHWTARIVALPVGNKTFHLMVMLPDDELLVGARLLLLKGLNFTFFLLVAVIPLAIYFAWRIGRPLRALADEARSMQHLNFTKPITLRSHLEETNTLTHSIDEARQAILRFVTLSSALAQADDLDQLSASLMREVMSAAHLQSGMLYLLDKDNARAVPHFSRHDGADFVAPEIHLAVDLDSVLSLTLLHGKRTLRQLQQCYPSDLAILGEKSELLGDSGMLVGIPLKDNAGEILGAIMLMGPFSDENESAQLLSFLEALSSNAATAIKNRQLILDQKALFEAMIDLIAGAIDAKSRYTGAHCQRVPVLTRMLAEAACRQTEGPFSRFSLSKEQWWELHVASGLHDCGKITTPEFVVDKATKLETIYDRIHEIRMRFEVLKRDREILSLRSRARLPSNEEQSYLAEQLRQLDEDFYFIASCNTGSELMAPENLQRIQAIATYTWARTLDDRIGISREELERKARTVEQALPVLEQVLEDKLEHLFQRSPKEQFAPDNPWGFKVDVPEYLYNRGELYNLSISRGTLTSEERYKINEHILQTIMMLERLPLPEQLSNVPAIAGGHHERMDGGGYPRRLKGMEMSAVARMMAIADIFEAITAADRPYKKGKTLSETVTIMQKMADEGHIDPQLFALFLQERLHLHYAAQFMAAEQIDL